VLFPALMALAFGATVLTAQAPPTAAGGTAGEIRVLTIEGVINPVSARYLIRELGSAEAAGAAALVLRLDTPGGLEISMRRMLVAILGSDVPIIVYVAPPGAHAASAGLFILLAADVAAMAPGTNTGAAHPVTIGAEQPDTTLAEKMVSDAAALARSVAERRGRNAEWAERAVRLSESATAREALALNVIDLVAADLATLLAEVDGYTVATAAGDVVLRTAGAPLVERPMSLFDRILHALTDPNIAYLLLTIGFIGIIAELYNPGAIFPGLTGLISLILAFVALGSLPVNWAGVVLLLLGIGLFITDMATEGIGVLAVGGVIAFVLGSLMLYRPFTPISPTMPEVRVSPELIGAATAGMAIFLVFVGRALLRSRHQPVASGAPALVGRVGVAVTPLAPHGTVRVDQETWSATAVEGDGPIGAGEPIEVAGLEGVTLFVRKRSPGAPLTREEV
jgi:membrane-bound serine protease (ClpP class)